MFENLYKKTSEGKIQIWSIAVFGRKIVTEFGELGGKIQSTTDIISKGKNIGKANETDPETQALAEATSKFNKKLKSGYVNSVEKAESGEVDEVVEGGINPMLAHSFNKHGSKVKYPCAVQPKLDGIRCVAVKKGDNVTLWSRTRKIIKSCPHISEEIAKVFKGVDIVLDGELYNHEYKSDFEKIVSAVRKDHPTSDALKVQYHIYDIARDGGFRTRDNVLECHLETPSHYLYKVATYEAFSESVVKELFDQEVSYGFEGVMLRSWEGPYEYKRSYNLMKVKEFEDKEYEIVGVEEGRGKLSGLVGAFVCKTEGGVEFKAKPSGCQEATKDFLENPELVIGKLLTVQFQGLTGKNGVPRFPVGLRIREEGL